MGTATNSAEALQARIVDLADWLDCHPGRMPSAYRDRDQRERSLAYFLTRMRRADAAGHATPMVVEALDRVLPTWRVSLKSPEHWDARLAVAHEQANASTRKPPRFPDFKTDEPAIRSTATWALASWRGPEYGYAADATRRPRLQQVHGWTEPRPMRSPGSRNDLVVLRRHAEQAAAFHGDHGRPPSQTGPEPGEGPLGDWLSNQRDYARSGDPRWTPEREAILDDVYPGWSGTPDRYDWNGTLRAVVRYRTRHGHLPPRGRLCRWLAKRRYEARVGAANLTPERLALLDQRLPGWRD